MGMYTELYVSFKVKKEAPKEVTNVLLYLFGEGEEPQIKPKHDFFDCPRWSMIGKCCSFYFIPFSTHNIKLQNVNNSYYVTSRSDLKNYDGEIEAFIDWVKPYIDAEDGEHIGHYRYEEEKTPTLIFK